MSSSNNQTNNNDDATVTLVHAVTGESEVVPVDLHTTTVANVLELAQALLGSGSSLIHNGRRLDSSSTVTLDQAGVKGGDLLMLAPQQQQRSGGGGNRAGASVGTSTTSGSTAVPPSVVAPAPSGGGGGGGLDFSNLLASAGAAAAPPAAAAAPAAFSLPGSGSSNNSTPTPVYYPHMSLDDAMQYNPHPAAIVPLLLEKQHLWKELHHHNPKLALAIQTQPPNLQASIAAWRKEVALGAVNSAVKQSQAFHLEQRMQRQLQANPDDAEAVAYFETQKNRAAVQQQFQQMMQEYPESLAKVLMLYVPARINGHQITAFCDSGAQSTIMSKKLAQQVGVLHLVDDRFAGTAVGVGTGTILGRIHLVQLELVDEATKKQYYFPCTITVMDDPPPGASEMPFLLGLDMMKRHLCRIDLELQVLQFKIGHSSGEYMQVPFLHEKDLEQHQGGTRGFDAEQANAELLEKERQMEEDEEKEQKDEDKKKNGNDDDKDDKQMSDD